MNVKDQSPATGEGDVVLQPPRHCGVPSISIHVNLILENRV
jgi:hypothetical protein